MQFTSTLLFFTFIAANLCSPVPDAPPQVSIAPSAECFMPLGLNLTIVKPLTDVVYSFQHSHVAVTVKAGTDYVDKHDHVSLGISIGSDSEEMSTDAIGQGVTQIWDTCAQGTVAPEDKDATPFKKACKKNKHVPLGVSYVNGVVIYLCYKAPQKGKSQ